MKFFAKNPPEGFAIHRFTCAGEILPQRIINECLVPAAYSIAEPTEPWRTIFANAQLRIQYRGDRKLTSHQEEQIEAAAKLIELALR